MGTRSRPLSEITDADVPTILDDLQLAAELGKTLLERNKELEQALKHHQNIIDDQSQEIEYLRKQNTALREVNDSRLRIYEQLEVSIQDLERDKHRLAVEGSSDKKKLKGLSQNVECLETKCDDLSKQINELQTLLDMERRKNKRLMDEGMQSAKSVSSSKNRPFNLNLSVERVDDQDVDETSIATPTNNEDINCIFVKKSNSKTKFKPSPSKETDEDRRIEEAQIKEYEQMKISYLSLCDKINELEEQLRLLTEENQALQLKLATVNDREELKSVQEELSILEEVRQGQMCTRCLRSTETRMVPEEDVSFIGTEEDDDQSLMDLIRSSEPGTPVVYRSTLNIKAKTCRCFYNMCPSCLSCATRTTTNNYFRLCHSLCSPKFAIFIHHAAILQIFVKKCWTLLKKHSHILVKLLQWPTFLLYQLIEAASVIDVDDTRDLNIIHSDSELFYDRAFSHYHHQ